MEIWQLKLNFSFDYAGLGIFEDDLWRSPGDSAIPMRSLGGGE